MGLAVLIALVGGLLDRNTRGSTIVVGPLNLGGSLEMLHNPVAIVELAVDKKATTVLMPVSARRGLMDLPDEYWTKTNVEFYSDTADGVFKALIE
jgi:ATP-dependent Lon protease